MRAFRLAYDGTDYYGYQRQPSVPTVEGALFDALTALDVTEPDTKPVGYAAAGRTDRGVSATHQTVAFDAPEWVTPRALNSELPAAIRAWASASVPSSFHATHHAEKREYTYLLYSPSADGAVIEAVLSRVSGTHDFHNFTPDEEGTVRTLRTAVRRDGDLFRVTLESDGFARQLVRRLLSIVNEIAVGDRPIDVLERLLSPESVSGPAGVAPAPAEPLILTAVSYPAVTFSVDTEALERTTALFQKQHNRLISRTAVLSELASLDS